MNEFVVRGLTLAIVLTGSTLAQAQEGAPAPSGEPAAAAEGAPAAPAVAPPPAAATKSTVVADGARFRFGVAAGAGFFTAATESGNAKASFTYFGTDLRFGVQVNDLIGVYAQQTLGYYSGSGALAAGGLL